MSVLPVQSLFTYASFTPPQFFPGQEPIYSDQGANVRNMYKKVFNHTTTVETTIRKQYIGRSTDAYGRMNRIKSINVGKYAYVPGDKPTLTSSTKSVNPSYVRSVLKQVRNN
jgi:hypothetical protein